METIDPWQVRFTHDTINKTFRDGRSVDELAVALRLGLATAENVEPIRLVRRDVKLYSLDNRRLEAFRRASKPIAFRMARPEEEEDFDWKFTTMNDGTSIRVR